MPTPARCLNMPMKSRLLIKVLAEPLAAMTEEYV
jgi:hypothetical protein